jgi:hypothetical protein
MGVNVVGDGVNVVGGAGPLPPVPVGGVVVPPSGPQPAAVARSHAALASLQLSTVQASPSSGH